MKKIIASILLLGLLFSCSPKFVYFTTDTEHPQHVVDSLLPSAGNYRDWYNFQTIGINAGDSTAISAFIYLEGSQKITVVDYANSPVSTVTEKRQVRK